MQPGRDVELEYTSRAFGCDDGFSTVDIHPDGNVQWTASVSDQTWITIWADGCGYDAEGNVNGTGDATLQYVLAPYVGDGTPRTGWIAIGGKKVYITQRAYDLSIDPSAVQVDGNAGSGEVGVPATVGAVWNAIATEPWITIVPQYDSGTGSGVVMFSYQENATGKTRTGKIVISGEEYTITQASRQLVKVSVRSNGPGGVVSGAGTYDRGTGVTLQATTNSGYEFVGWTRTDGTESAENPLTFAADVDREYVATFRRVFTYVVNGQTVRGDTPVSFAAPAPTVDANGTTQLVCRGTSAFPDRGASFTLTVTSDIEFTWDLWETNYWLEVEAPPGGTILENGSSAASRWVAAGETVSLTAAAEAGRTFFRWAGDADDRVRGNTTLPLVMDGPKGIGAVFGVWGDDLSQAADAPGLEFTTGGDAAWTPVVDATTEAGFSSVRSGAVGAESETWLQTTVHGSGELTFKWKVDCERDVRGLATWDRLAVFTNGVEVARIDGKTGWRTVVINCSPPAGGKTVVRWSFYRDDWDEGDEESAHCGWVDGIIWNGKEGE